jgi:hypothetical protein
LNPIPGNPKPIEPPEEFEEIEDEYEERAEWAWLVNNK